MAVARAPSQLRRIILAGRFQSAGAYGYSSPVCAPGALRVCQGWARVQQLGHRTPPCPCTIRTSIDERSISTTVVVTTGARHAVGSGSVGLRPGGGGARWTTRGRGRPRGRRARPRPTAADALRGRSAGSARRGDRRPRWGGPSAGPAPLLGAALLAAGRQTAASAARRAARRRLLDGPFCRGPRGMTTGAAAARRRRTTVSTAWASKQCSLPDTF